MGLGQPFVIRDLSPEHEPVLDTLTQRAGWRWRWSKIREASDRGEVLLERQ
jgi:hypothetical protein